MTQALWITAIGMGLVFLAILLLWAMMALLVRLTAEKPSSQVVDAPTVSLAAPDGGDQRVAVRRRAAAAAVVVALSAEARSSARRIATNRPDRLSAWQVVQRAAQHQQPIRSSKKKDLR